MNTNSAKGFVRLHDALIGKDPVNLVPVPGRKFAMYPKPGKSAKHATSAVVQLVTILNDAG